MNKIAHKATVSTAMTGILLKYAVKIGMDSNKLCSIAGIDPSVFKESEARISVEQFNALWKEAKTQSGRLDFGLDFGRELALNYHSGHILFAVMMNSPTVGAAMDKFVKYHNLMADAIRPELSQQGNSVHFACVNAHSNSKIPRHIAEALLSMFIHILRLITDNNLKLIKARFSHSRPSNISGHEQVFDAPLAFDQTKSELILEKEFMNLPMFMPNPELLRTLEQFARNLLSKLYHANTWSFKVTRELGELLIQGEKPGTKSVADNLAMSVRSLQQKLKTEGTTYRNLLDEVRREIAINFLRKDDMTICDIAFFLGFSEQSAFNHAFKRWTGVAPKEYTP